MTATGSATLLIDAPRERVRAVLLDALALPSWNSAFRLGRLQATVTGRG